MTADPEQTSLEVNPRALELIFEHTKDAPAKQSARVDALDAKITQVFGAASIILGFGAITAVRDAVSPFEWGLVAGSLAAYVVVAIAAGIALWPRQWLDNTHAVWLWKENYFRSPEEIRLTLVADLESVLNHNDKGLRIKVIAIGVAIALTAVETALMIASVLAAAA